MSELQMDIETLLLRFGQERRTHYDLENFKKALQNAGNPERNVESLVVAGTNGKGSVTLLTTEALARSGRNVATYMSPHLVSVCERFLWNGKPVAAEELSALGFRYYELAKKNALSYFEFLTLLFFLWAKEKKADTLVLEVGLGGRLDATNVTVPRACAITSIGFDHMEVLGNSLALILREKFAVVPPKGILVSNVGGELPSLCKEKGIRLIESGNSIISTGKRDWTSQEVSLGTLKFKINNPNPKWAENANTAYALLKSSYPPMEDTTIAKAFNDVRFNGRFETISEKPHVILSGDHNPDGIDSLLETIKLLPPKEIHILCGFSLDKPYKELFGKLKPIGETITLTSFPKQGIVPEEYKLLTNEYIENPILAYEALKKNIPANGVLIVTGSLYLVGTLRAHILA